MSSKRFSSSNHLSDAISDSDTDSDTEEEEPGSEASVLLLGESRKREREKDNNEKDEGQQTSKKVLRTIASRQRFFSENMLNPQNGALPNSFSACVGFFQVLWFVPLLKTFIV